MNAGNTKMFSMAQANRTLVGSLVLISLWACIFATPVHLAAQFPGQGQFPGQERNPMEDTTFAKSSDWIKIDSVNLYYTYMHDPENHMKEPRDTMDFDFHQYDPTRKQDIFFQNLGNVGSAARSQLFRGYQQKGVHSGMHQYDLYLAHPDRFKFYDTEIPVADFYASQGGSQDDGMLEAKFGRNFAQGYKLSILYSRINQLGLYQDQRNRLTNFGVGVQVDGENDKYDGYFGYISNAYTHQNNGGITSYDSLASEFRQLRMSVMVHLNNAVNTLRERHFFSTHYFHILSKGDSLRSPRKIFDLKYSVRYFDYLYKYTDEDIGTSAEYYGPFITDDRGMRNFIGYTKFINEAGFILALDEGNSLSGSLEHRLVNINQEPVESRRNEVFINGRLRTSIFQRFRLDANGYLGLLDASANFNLEGRATLDLSQFGMVGGRLRIHQRRPDLIEENLYVNQIPVWQNDFKNVNTNLLEVSYRNPGWNLEGAIRWFLIDNYIYYGPDFFPAQLDEAISIQQIYLRGAYKLAFIRLEAAVGIQNYEAEEIALPNLILEGSAALTGRIFRRKLKFQLGTDFRFTNAYNGAGFFPLAGQFYVDDSRMVSSYPALDPFIAVQIGSLKVFLKWENINSVWSDEVYDQVIGYPQFENYFRFGISFQLFN